MKLHKDLETFEVLAQQVSQWRHIPVEAIQRDYLIVLMLQKLEHSKFVNKCVFKGGTSLSKCYSNTIERFSEDVDLTFLETELSEKQKDRAIKNIEKIICQDLSFEKIPDERSKIAKSSWVWLDDIGKENRVKLEIGSTIRPEPSRIMTLKTYYQEYLEYRQLPMVITEFELTEVNVKVLDITRTFLDKILAVKRHANNNDLLRKTRHIYDVVRLFNTDNIQQFLQNREELKELLTITKQTDRFFIDKRKNHRENYQPNSPFAFEKWKENFDTREIRYSYENLHKELLYTEISQSFDEAIKTFEEINELLKNVENA